MWLETIKDICRALLIFWFLFISIVSIYIFIQLYQYGYFESKNFICVVQDVDKSSED